MKRFLPLLIILPLLFWLGCEDESEGGTIPDDAPIYGLWEWRYYYNQEFDDWEEITTINWWSLLSEENYSENFLLNFDTDSACYSDWIIVDDGSTSVGIPTNWEISAEDSATITLLWNSEDPDDYFEIGLKAVEDTLYFYIHNQLSSKAIRIDSYDFTPLCE